MRLAALTLVLALLSSASALAASTEDLAGLSNRQYVDYVRDRFEWLTGQGRTSHLLARKFRRECQPASGGSESANACEIVKAADEQADQVVKEGQDLLAGLQRRLGSIPPWARQAEAALAASVGK